MPASRKCFSTVCGNRRPCRASTSVPCPLLCIAGRDCMFNLPPDSNRVTQRGAYHFLGASRPALILARICNRDCQVVSTVVAALLCTGRALGPVISRPLMYGSDMVQNAKFPPRGVVRRQLNLRFGPEFLGHFEARDEADYLSFCDLPQALQIVELRFQLVICAIEPVSFLGCSMDAQRPANGVTKFVWPELILARKDLNPFGETGASSYRHLKAKGEIVDVDAAMSRQQWLVGKDPEVSATARLLQCRLNPILAQFPLQLKQVIQGILIVGINRHPLGALCPWVQSIDTDCELPVQVLAEGLQRQSPVVSRTVIVVFAVSVWPVRLHGVGQAIHKQVEVSSCHFHCGLAYTIHTVISITPLQCCRSSLEEMPGSQSAKRGRTRRQAHRIPQRSKCRPARQRSRQRRRCGALGRTGR